VSHTQSTGLTEILTNSLFGLSVTENNCNRFHAGWVFIENRASFHYEVDSKLVITFSGFLAEKAQKSTSTSDSPGHRHHIFLTTLREQCVL